MSIGRSPPVSLQAIRNDFQKGGSVGSTDRYVIDFAQRDGVTWDLLDYAGQAYGLQYQLSGTGYGGGAGGSLAKDSSDPRVEGVASQIDVDGGTYVSLGQDGRGKYGEISHYQDLQDQSPGSTALNGIWFANELGQYRMRATLETASDFSSIAEAGVFVFGYRYGYLDGDRATYSLWGNNSRPGPNKTLTCDVSFNVQDAYRHIVVNVNVWMPGRWGYDRGAFKVRDLTIEKV